MAIYYGGGGAVEREYLYIDGGCLRAAVRQISLDTFGNADEYQPYIPAVASGSFAKVYYYDAIPGREHGEPQATYETRVLPDHQRLDRIQALDRVHVAPPGQIVGVAGNKRQKGVDVRLAVDMMTHAFRGNISKATLFAGDADFVPLVRSLVAEGLHVTLWHPTQANAELKGAADNTRLFSFKTDYQCLTLDGSQSAFQIGGSSGGAIGPGTAGRGVTVGDYTYSGSFQQGELSLRRVEGRIGSHVTMRAPGATLERAVQVFDILHGWELAALGTDWIVTA